MCRGSNSVRHFEKPTLQYYNITPIINVTKRDRADITLSYKIIRISEMYDIWLYYLIFTKEKYQL